jgi:hypothetical protein
MLMMSLMVPGFEARQIILLHIELSACWITVFNGASLHSETAEPPSPPRLGGGNFTPRLGKANGSEISHFPAVRVRMQ